jgi:hypothetical protein
MIIIMMAFLGLLFCFDNDWALLMLLVLPVDFEAILVVAVLTICDRRVEWMMERNIVGRRAFMAINCLVEV